MALAMAVAPAAAVPFQPGPAAAPQVRKPHRSMWDLGELVWVKLVAREAATPLNDHPAQVDPEILRQVLAAVTVATGGKDEPLFAKAELALLLEPICEALGLADPEEDLVLLSTHRRGGGFMTAPTGITARLFLREGRLNVIVRDTRLDFVNKYRVDHELPRFRYGSRSEQGTSALRGAGIEFRRSDWMVLPLKAAPLAALAPAPVLTPGLPRPPGPMPITGKPGNTEFYAEQEARLKALKRMRDEKLITEDEYQAKRKEVLKSF
jgi:hypothetical protein